MTTTTTESMILKRESVTALPTTMTPSALNEQERDLLVTRHLALVRRVCARFRTSGEPMEDLVQEGNVGLLKAVKKFDPRLGNSFAAYAIPVIIGEVKNYFRDHGWAVKIPRKLQRRKLAVDRAITILNQELGRSPTVHDIAEATEFSEDEIYQTFEIEAYGKPASLNAEINSGESDATSTILDHVGDVDPELEGLPNRLDLARTLDCLDQREKAIICLYYYQDLSQIEIAKKLALSQMHVSRLQRGALSKLRSELASYVA